MQPGENGDRISAAPSQIAIPSVLSAQVSLLCEGDEDQAITYVSRALDVSLRCDQVTDSDDTPDE